VTLKISWKNLEKILEHAEKSLPIEACGILAGRRVEQEGIVERVYPVRNLLNSSSEYQMDPQEQIRVFEEVEREGLEVIGFYHSHPYWEPLWSRIDDERSKPWTGYSFLIVSPKTGNYRAYFRMEEKTVEEDIIVLY